MKQYNPVTMMIEETKTVTEDSVQLYEIAALTIKLRKAEEDRAKVLKEADAMIKKLRQDSAAGDEEGSNKKYGMLKPAILELYHTSNAISFMG